MTTSMYRVGRVGGGGLYNGHATPKAKQAWTVGAIVNVGFVRGLMVMARRDGDYMLQNIANGRKYAFTPHDGLFAI